MHPHAVAGTMESIRTPSPPADARVPRETPRGADGDIEGLEPALSDVLTPNKEEKPTPGRRLPPVKRGPSRRDELPHSAHKQE